MVISNSEQSISTAQQSYDKASELKAFDDTKAGVKGLVDAGITEVPRFFIHPEASENHSSSKNTQFIVPLIDLENINTDPIKHKVAVDRIRDASETWGFFQVINHGIPASVLEEMLRGGHRFFEQDVSLKKPYYNRDPTKTVNYYCNHDLLSPKAVAANWRDSLLVKVAPVAAKPEELPETCREIIVEYLDHATKLGDTLLELLSQGLGQNPSDFKETYCAEERVAVMFNYYPACPQPELAIGNRKHTDANLFTVLLQDDVGGLQVLHQNQWVDASPTPGALVINIGDLLQLFSNDKYKSIEHRVLTNKVGPRISVATFFNTGHPISMAKLKEIYDQKKI